MKRLPLCLFPLSVLLLAACGGGGSSSNTTTASGTSKLTLRLSDAPVEHVSKVCIAISALRLKRVEDIEEHLWTPLSLLPSASEQDECLPDGYSIPLDSSGAPRFLYLDLLHYQQGNSHLLLSDSEIASGDYEQLRLKVEDGRAMTLDGTPEHPSSYVLDDNGNTLPLEVPSSELKLASFTATTDGTLSYQIEFNLRHALVLPGHGNYYKLKPRGVELLTVSSLSTLQGEVADTLCAGDLSQAGVYLYPARSGSTLPYLALSSESEEGGPQYSTLLQQATSSSAASYQLFYLQPGNYDLALICNASQDAMVDDDESSSFVPQIGSLITGLNIDPITATGYTADLILPLDE